MERSGIRSGGKSMLGQMHLRPAVVKCGSKAPCRLLTVRRIASGRHTLAHLLHTLTDCLKLPRLWQRQSIAAAAAAAAARQTAPSSSPPASLSRIKESGGNVVCLHRYLCLFCGVHRFAWLCVLKRALCRLTFMLLAPLSHWRFLLSSL